MIVGQDQIDRAMLQFGQRALRIDRGTTIYAPALKQGTHAIEDGRVVVQAQHSQWQFFGRYRLIDNASACDMDFRTWHGDRETTAVADARRERHAVTENARNALTNGQAQARAFPPQGRGPSQPLKLAEYSRLLLRRYARTGIADIDTHFVADTPRTQQDA